MFSKKTKTGGQRPFFALGSALLTFLLAGCFGADQPETAGSDAQGYTSGELKQTSLRPQRERAVQLLEDNGWCGVPASARPSGWSTSYLVRHMACVANKESTFGQAPYGPNTGDCGVAYGYWQVAQCHIGKSVTFEGKTYRCDAASTHQLAHSAEVAARCALYVYMQAVSEGRRGIAPWEATCSQSEVTATDHGRQPVFRLACEEAQQRVCGDGLRTAFQGNNLVVQSSALCRATKVVLEVFKAEGSRVSQLVSGEFPWAESTTQGNRVTIDLSALRRSEHNKVRVILAENTTRYFVTNPSLTLPAMAPVSPADEVDPAPVDGSLDPAETSVDGSGVNSDLQTDPGESGTSLVDRCAAAFPGDENRKSRIDCLFGKIDP